VRPGQAAGKLEVWPGHYPSEDRPAEYIDGKLVERLRAKHEVSHAKRMPAQPSSSLPERRAPGVSFDLLAAEYNADPSPGSTDLKRLRQAPARATLQIEDLHDPKLVTDSPTTNGGQPGSKIEQV